MDKGAGEQGRIERRRKLPEGETRWLQNYLPAGSAVGEKIAAQYPTFSKALRTFADFVAAEPMKVAQLSINDTVHESGVSVATANRFARRLGYDSYPAFRSELIGSFESVFAPVDRLRRTISKGSEAEDVFASVLGDDISNLQETLRSTSGALLREAADMLIGARNVFVLAFDQGLPLAQIFAHNLTVSGRTAATPPTGGKLAALAHIASYGKEDLVVTFGFPRYIRDTVEVARTVHRRGVPMLVVTDAPSSPLASLGKLTLYIRAQRAIGATSDAAILSVLEGLSSCVAVRQKGAADAAGSFSELAHPWLIGR